MKFKILVCLNLITVNILASEIKNSLSFEVNQHSYFNEGIEEDYQKFEQQESLDPYPVEDVPINDYLPLLVVAAVGLGFYYRKELNQTIKSN